MPAWPIIISWYLNCRDVGTSRAFVGFIWPSSADVLFFLWNLVPSKKRALDFWCKTMACSGALIPIDFHLLYGWRLPFQILVLKSVAHHLDCYKIHLQVNQTWNNSFSCCHLSHAIWLLRSCQLESLEFEFLFLVKIQKHETLFCHPLEIHPLFEKRISAAFHPFQDEFRSKLVLSLALQLWWRQKRKNKKSSKPRQEFVAMPIVFYFLQAWKKTNDT